MRILLMEPHTLLCESLATLITAQRPSVQLETFNELPPLQRALQTPAEKLILSTGMKDNLFEFVSRQRKKYSTLPIYMLVEGIYLPWVHLLLKAGATGTLPKALSSADFIKCLFTPLSQQPMLPLEIKQQLDDKEQCWKESPFSALTRREWDTLLLSFKGLSLSQVSQQLHLSPKTVSIYRLRCMQKLEVTSVMEAYCLAMDYGLLGPQSLRQLQQTM